MVRGLALLSCVACAACLEAPEEGVPGEGDLGPDRPGGDGAGGDDGTGTDGNGADGEPGEALAACPDGSAADIVYPSLIQVPTGQANLGFTGIAVLVNTGDVPLDLAYFLPIADDVPGYNVTPVISVSQLGDQAPVGQAVGQWGLAPGLLAPNLPEPWTDTTQPRVDLSIQYDIPSPAELDIMMIVDQQTMGGVMPIHVQVAGSGPATVVETSRLPLACDAE